MPIFRRLGFDSLIVIQLHSLHISLEYIARLRHCFKQSKVQLKYKYTSARLYTVCKNFKDSCYIVNIAIKRNCNIIRPVFTSIDHAVFQPTPHLCSALPLAITCRKNGKSTVVGVGKGWVLYVTISAVSMACCSR